MMTQPFVSIVVPFLNAERFLDRTIASILNQTYPYYEIIFIDDGSTDGSADIIKQYLKSLHNISLIQNKENLGPGPARNIAIRHAIGEYIAFMDSDDLWVPSKIEKQVAMFESDEKIALVYCNVQNVTENGDPTGERSHHTASGKILNEILKDTIFDTSAVMIKRSILRGNMLFSEDVRAAEDWELWLKIALDYKIACIPDALLLKRTHEGQVSNNLARNMTCEDIVFDRFLRHNRDRIGWNSLRIAKAYYHNRHGYYNRELGKVSESTSEFLKAWLLNPWNLDPLKGIVLNLTKKP